MTSPETEQGIHGDFEQGKKEIDVVEQWRTAPAEIITYPSSLVSNGDGTSYRHPDLLSLDIKSWILAKGRGEK